MSDERKIEEEVKSEEEDVEAHHKVKQASTEPSEDDGDDVVAHHKVKQ